MITIKGSKHIHVKTVRGKDGTDTFTVDVSPKLKKLLNQLEESGVDGLRGPPGQDGVAGPPGRDGRDGKDGVDGLRGPPGRDGATVTVPRGNLA